MQGAIHWFSRNHVAGNFLMLAILLAGFTTWFKLKKEIFPEISIDAVAIQLPYPNATPEEVETGVCIPVEEAIADLEGIKRIRTTAAQNMGIVMVEVETGFETRNLMDDLKTRVDAIDNFPEEAEKPLIQEMLIKSPVMSIALSADTDETTLRKLAEEIRDDLLAYDSKPSKNPLKILGSLMRGKDSISQIELAGIRPYEISIEIPEARLRELNLTLGQVASSIRRSSVDIPGGSIRSIGGEIILRTLGKKYQAADFASIPITSLPDGSKVKLGDIANLVNTFEEIDLTTKYDGEQATIINVYRVGNEDTTALANMVYAYIAEKNTTLPQGVKLSVWNDQSLYLKGRMDLLARNATFGLLLVLLVLTLFLRPSLALLVALGIPVSFAGGIWMMPMLGVSINMISLFAFILVLGIVVDDAIVTGENVYTRIQKGEHPRLAAPRGTHEVGTIVIFGVLTTAVAFTPMLGLSGVSGKIWPNIPLIVIPTLLVSLLQSKFVLPAHLSLLAPTNRKKHSNPLMKLQRKIAESLEWFVAHIYRPALTYVLHWRWVVWAAFGFILITSVGLVANGYIKFQFFPEVEGDVLSAKIELVQGVPFSNTQKIINELERTLQEVDKELLKKHGESVVKHILASSGTQPFQTGFNPNGPPRATHIGEVTVELTPAANRGVPASEIIDLWRAKLSPMPGVISLSIQAETAGGGNAIDIALTGEKKNMKLLHEAVGWVKEELAGFDGVIEIADSNRKGKDEVRLTRLTPTGEATGLQLGDVAIQMRDSFYGNEVQRLQRGRDEVKVMVRYPKQERKSLENLEEMRVLTPTGGQVPLQQIAEFSPGSGPSTVERTDRRPSIKITADVTKGTNANKVVKTFQKNVLNKIPEKFPGVHYAFEGEQSDQADSIREIGMGFLSALIIMYVLIAIPLKSYFQPFIIMSVIPFGIIGAIWGHVAFGMNLSIMSMCGVVALSGVVVNDSLVMVDFVNRHINENITARQAAIMAGQRRFRAIILTSLTTFAGLMPMLVETDMQARFLIPMAVSLGFGILFATLITLFLVPCIYLILDDVSNAPKTLKSLYKNSRNRSPQSKLPPQYLTRVK